MKEYTNSQLLRDWGELEAAGISLEPLEFRVGLEDRRNGPALTIRQLGAYHEALLSELNGGRFAYVANVFIRCNRPGKTIIRSASLCPPWMDTDIELLEDPRHEGRHPQWYSFPAETYRYYRDSVLNHRIHCEMSRGDIREGLLLAVSPVRPPENLRNNDKVCVTLRVLDQWDIEQTAELRMWVNRFPTRVKEIRKSTRGSLLEHPDAIPV